MAQIFSVKANTDFVIEANEMPKGWAAIILPNGVVFHDQTEMTLVVVFNVNEAGMHVMISVMDNIEGRVLADKHYPDVHFVDDGSVEEKINELLAQIETL